MNAPNTSVWNHRVIRKLRGDRLYFEIHEVYYDADGKPDAWTEDAVAPFGESLDELRRDCQIQRLAFSKPVLFVDRVGDKEILRECEPEIIMQDRWLEHEAMDRSSQFVEMFYNQVASHPAVSQNEKLKKQAKVITAALCELYQMTSNPHQDTGKQLS
ncbi:MAG: hypothetical protein H7A51_14575 [Akkermansiaceae bacterium]|nr:hypothetical protein [Akkermansiaceae bacterium]